MIDLGDLQGGEARESMVNGVNVGEEVPAESRQHKPKKDEPKEALPAKNRGSKKKATLPSRCELNHQSDLHNGGKRILKAKFIVEGNDTLTLKEFLNSETLVPVGDVMATKAKWRDEGSIFSLSIMDVATLLSGNPAVVDDNEYHKTLNYQRRHGFMGPIFNGGKRGWTRGLKYIISAIGLVFSPVRIVYELLRIGLYYLDVGLEMLPYYTETAATVSNGWNVTANKIINVTGTRIFSVAYEQYRRFFALPLWLHFGIPIRRVYRRLRGPWIVNTIWNTLPDMFVYLFPNYKKSYKRTEVAVLEHCMSLLHDEEKRLLHKIDTLTRNINLDYGPHNSISNCLKIATHLKLWVVLRIIFAPLQFDKEQKGSW